MNWCYTCGDEKILGKVTAIKQEGTIHFHAPVEYEKFDFTQEPEENWEDLIKLELQKIRNTYSYVRFFYSGGIDSHCLLEVILKYNIFIDEIVAIKSGISSADHEVINFVEPFLKKIQTQIPKTKITIKCPTIQNYIDYYKNPNWVEDWFKEDFNNPSFHFRILCQDIHTSSIGFDNKENECNIQGKEKPLLLYHKGGWYTYFIDNQVEYAEGHVFPYIDNPKIHAKQSYMLLNKIKETIPWHEFNNTTLGTLTEDRQNFLNENTGRCIFSKKFPYKKIGTTNSYNQFKINNETFYSFNEKDFLAINEFAKIDFNTLINWKRGTEQAQSVINKKWIEKSHFEYGTVGVLSKFYQLDGPGNIKTVDDLFPNGFMVV